MMGMDNEFESFQTAMFMCISESCMIGLAGGRNGEPERKKERKEERKKERKKEEWSVN